MTSWAGEEGGAASQAANAMSGRAGKMNEFVRQEMSKSSARAPTLLNLSRVRWYSKRGGPMHVRVNASVIAGIVLGANGDSDEGSLSGGCGEALQVRNGQTAGVADRTRKNKSRGQEGGDKPD